MFTFRALRFVVVLVHFMHALILQKMMVESGTSKIVGFRFSSASFICLISNEILRIVARYLCQPKHHFIPHFVLCKTCFNFGMRIKDLALRIVPNFPQYDLVVLRSRASYTYSSLSVFDTCKQATRATQEKL